MRVLVRCEDATYEVEVGASAEDDSLEDTAADPFERKRPAQLVPDWASSHLVDVDALGSAIVLLLDRRPPLMVSQDRGQTWSERGGGLPRGRAVALGDHPDHVLFAGRNRLYVSTDGGRFWRSVGVELPEIDDIAWA